MATLCALPRPFLNCPTNLGSSSSLSFATGTSSLRLVPNGSALSSRIVTGIPQRLEVNASKQLMGKVVTDTNDKSVTVEVIRIAVWPKYGKRVRKAKNYIVHDPENAARKGDMVTLARCAPVSKRKSFKVVEIRRGREEIPVTETTSVPPFQSASQTA